ncbi:uncharacterized protein LOC141905514 [Tubulanus polymorphus]|uniref:uncharacterized protein LOC141905514 n=1 Tax=Tubulanus polymorphus TaxID=672921 RepID=UPI003DA481AC
MSLNISWSAAAVADEADLYVFADTIRLVIVTVLVGFGTIGNVLSIIVLSRPNTRGTTISLYLRALAVTDTCILLLVALPMTIGEFWSIRFNKINHFTCLMMLFCSGLFPDLSSYILVVVAIERVISIYLPLKSTPHDICIPRKRFVHFWFAVYTHVDLIKYSILPFTILVVTNIAIVVKLRIYARNRSGLLTTRTSASSGANVDITVMLVCVCTFFIVTSSPVVVYGLLRGNKLIVPNQTVFNFCLLLVYANSAINFFLYNMTGMKFRSEMMLFVRQTVTSCNIFLDKSAQSRTKYQNKV